MVTTAKVAMAAGLMTAISPGVAVSTTLWRRCRPQKSRGLPCEALGRGRQQSGGMRPDARQARWADIALAGGAGADFTCIFPRSGRVGDARCARPLLRRRALKMKMMSSSPCLRAGTPAIMRVQRRRRKLCRRRGHRAERDRGGRRAEGSSLAHLRPLAIQAWTRDRLNVRALQPDGAYIRLI